MHVRYQHAHRQCQLTEQQLTWKINALGGGWGKSLPVVVVNMYVDSNNKLELEEGCTLMPILA